MASTPVIVIGKPLLKTYRRYAAYKQKFDDWRAVRPFWGGVLLMMAGLLLAYIPFYTLDNFAFTGGTAELIGLIGLVFAFFVFLSGVASITHPQISTLAGLTGIVMSILSIVGGTFGAMGIGTFVGMIGGSLCVAWIQEEETIAVDSSGDEDVDELRKKAEQYEQMMKEGELDPDEMDDVRIKDDEAVEAEAESETVETTTEAEVETEAGAEVEDETEAVAETDAQTAAGAEADTQAETESESVEAEPVTEEKPDEAEDTTADTDDSDAASDEDEEEDWLP